MQSWQLDIMGGIWLADGREFKRQQHVGLILATMAPVGIDLGVAQLGQDAGLIGAADLARR